MGHEAPQADGEASLVDRRTWLRLIGLATAAPLVASEATDSAQAATPVTGFGDGGYGLGQYGGTSTERTPPDSRG